MRNKLMVMGAAALAVLASVGVGLVAQDRPAAPGKAAGKAEAVEATLPKVPAYMEATVISNPEVAATVGQFFVLLQSDGLKVTDVVGAPFLMDGIQSMDESAVGEFIAKARQGSLAKKQTSTFVGFRILPPGNTWDTAQAWLAPLAAGDRAKALFDHAAKQNGWLVLAQIARLDGDMTRDDHVLIAVSPPHKDGKHRVIGFMD